MAADYSGALKKSLAPSGEQIDKRRFSSSLGSLPRPKSVRISVPFGEYIDSKESYAAIKEVCNGTPISISKTNLGDVIVTFKSKAEADSLLAVPAIKIQSTGKLYAVFDPVKPVIFVNIYNLPFELSDDAVKRKLMKYGDILSFRRGHHVGMPTVEDGIRHCRMKLSSPLPSFIHFGNESFQIRYSGQVQTCRRCDSPDHQARGCSRIRCFNCGELDHSIANCPEEPMCSICSDKAHETMDCHDWLTFGTPEPEKPDPVPEETKSDTNNVGETPGEMSLNLDKSVPESPSSSSETQSDIIPGTPVLFKPPKSVEKKVIETSNLQKLWQNTKSLIPTIAPPTLGPSFPLSKKAEGSTASVPLPRDPIEERSDELEEGEIQDSSTPVKRTREDSIFSTSSSSSGSRTPLRKRTGAEFKRSSAK